MRLNFPVLGGASAVIVVFWLTILALNYFTPLCPSSPVFELKAPFQRYGASGVAYLAPAPLMASDGDTNETATRSPYLVCENRRHALGPAHSLHVDISTLGKGRFSHWARDGFVFSTSDNSDPNTNGRSYLATRMDARGLGGSWVGEVSQNSSPARYLVEMHLYGNVGSIAYPSAGCEGKLEFLRSVGSRYWYQEHISYGEGKCTDGGVIEMRALDKTHWNWTWTGSGVSATGVLSGAGVSRH